MEQNKLGWRGRLFAALLIFGLTSKAVALQVNWTSSTNFYVDFSSGMQCDHMSFIVTNSDGITYSNLWVTLGSFTNSALRLGSGDPGQYPLGSLTNSQTKPAFFYVAATNSSGNNQFTVNVYKGYPGAGTLLTSTNFAITIQTTSANSANKVTGVTFTPTNNPVVGGTFKIAVFGNTGNVANGQPLVFTGATFTNWNAGAFQMVACSISVSNGTTVDYFLTNTLATASAAHITGTGDNYEADYWFRAISTTTSTTSNSPVSYLQNGGSVLNHCQQADLSALPPVLPATNQTLMFSPVGATQLYTNETVTFTLRVTNASVFDVTLDRLVDTLPAGFVYVANSSTFGGMAILEPTNASQVLTWSQPFIVSAGTSSDFVFRAIPTVPGYATNACVAYVQNSQIDTTLNTSDNAPATEVVRALIEPRAVNVTNSTPENQVLAAAAPGVLANTVEPNGFSATVISYTQPAHGTVTVNADGSYVYTPPAFYWGADSFTFTLTNVNLRASTATNLLTVNWVNQPPYFAKGADQTNNENTGAQTIANWATGIGIGTNDPAQTLTFQVANDNNSLFSVQPAVSNTGTLTYTPAPFAWGDANVSVYLSDNAGGISATQTFHIHINWVNQPPYFSKGANQTVNENAGAQSVASWATSISAGTNDPAQTLTFQVANDNNSLFSVQPAVSSTGTLTFTPTPNAFGSANVSVYLTDGAGGISATQTFVITVNWVNQQPTLNAIGGLNLVENWSLQTVNFSGITAGPANESTQTLAVTATSSNPSLVPNPTMNYTSPNATGSLTFTPATNSFGTATVMVIVKDNGGTANGGIDAVTNTFLVSVQGQTNYWYGSSNLTVNIFDATGSGGVSQTNYTGVLSVPATSTNPFTIKLAGAGTNFNSGSNYIWTIATTTRGVIGLTTNQFIVDTSAFTNDLAGGYFTVVLSGDGSSVNLVFTGNLPPVANPLVLTRAPNTSLKISISNLLTNYTSDPNGDARIFFGVGASTNGAYLSTNSSYILFAPTNNISESFTYSVRDARTYRPGDTVYVATSWITVLVTNAVGRAQSISSISGGRVTVQFAGIPHYAYDVQRATNISGPWLVIATTNAPANGLWSYTDNNPPQPSAFYRTTQH